MTTITPLSKEENIQDNSPEPANEPTNTPQDISPAIEGPKDSEVAQDFKDSGSRDDFMQELITSKKYFVSIKQKKYHKGLSHNPSNPKKTKLAKSGPKKKVLTAQEAADKADKKARNLKLTGLMGTIWIIIFLGLDLGILSIGVDMPFHVFGGQDNPPIAEETVEYELIE